MNFHPVKNKLNFFQPIKIYFFFKFEQVGDEILSNLTEKKNRSFKFRLPFNWRDKRQLIALFKRIEADRFVEFDGYQSKWYRLKSKTIRSYSTGRGPITVFFSRYSIKISRIIAIIFHAIPLYLFVTRCSQPQCWFSFRFDCWTKSLSFFHNFPLWIINSLEPRNTMLLTTFFCPPINRMKMSVKLVFFISIFD